MSQVTSIIDAMCPPGFRNSWASISYKASKGLDAFVVKLLEETIEKVKNVESLSLPVTLQGISKMAIQEGIKNGGNAIGLEPDDGPLTIVHLPWMWQKKEDDELMRSVQKEFIEKAQIEAQNRGVFLPFRYINYAADWQEPEPFEGYARKFDWLKKVQRRYDPEGVFTKGGLARGWWKLNEKATEPMRDEL